MFRLMKLRPPHGWGAVVWELAIVTLGVIIALGAQQLVEDIHARRDVGQMRRAFRAELADDRARWENMRASGPCTLQRLDAIEHWVQTAPAGARLEHPYRLLLWNMHSSAWDIAKASAATGDIPLRERLAFSDLYAAIDNWRELLAEERVNAVELSGLAETADQPDSRRQLMLAVAKARLFVRRRVENYPYFFTRFDALKIRPDASQITIARDPQALCQPVTQAARG